MVQITRSSSTPHKATAAAASPRRAGGATARVFALPTADDPPTPQAATGGQVLAATGTTLPGAATKADTQTALSQSMTGARADAAAPPPPTLRDATTGQDDSDTTDDTDADKPADETPTTTPLPDPATLPAAATPLPLPEAAPPVRTSADVSAQTGADAGTAPLAASDGKDAPPAPIQLPPGRPDANEAPPSPAMLRRAQEAVRQAAPADASPDATSPGVTPPDATASSDSAAGSTPLTLTDTPAPSPADARSAALASSIDGAAAAASPATRRLNVVREPARATPLSAAPVAASGAEPAGRAFAAAILATAPGRKRGGDPGSTGPDAAQILSATQTGTTATAPIAPAASTSGQTLDMSRPDWPEAMIARIDALRDAANANDTSIRLSPDALGTIDIGLRKDGDTVHISFTAANDTTRALLADAQPMLAAIAEQRGVALGQTSISGGTAGDGGHSARQQAAAAPSAPLSAPATAEQDLVDTMQDARIA